MLPYPWDAAQAGRRRKMDRVVLEGVTLGDLVYLGSAALVGLVVSFVVRIITGTVKRRLRSKDAACLRANLIDGIDGALSLLIILFGVYVGLSWQPALTEYRDIIASAFVIIGICIALYGGIRAQDDAIRWALGRVGERTGQDRTVVSVTPMATQMAASVTIAMGGLIVLDRLGISIAPLVAGLGIGGLAVALALQGTLTNLFAGLSVTTDGSIRVGDYVELEGGMVGAIDHIGWRTTRVRLLSNNIVFVPNSRLAGSITTNFNYPYEEMSVYMQIGVSYFSDLAHVERVTVEVARQVLQETPGAVRDYEPSVWYENFGDSNINFWVVMRSDGYLNSWTVKHAFVKALARRYEEEGIEISFPARNVFMREARWTRARRGGRGRGGTLPATTQYLEV